MYDVGGSAGSELEVVHISRCVQLPSQKYRRVIIFGKESLPTAFDTPMFWSTEELAELVGTSIAGASLFLENEIRKPMRCLDKIGKEESERDYSEKVLPIVQVRMSDSIRPMELSVLFSEQTRSVSRESGIVLHIGNVPYDGKPHSFSQFSCREVGWCRPIPTRADGDSQRHARRWSK